MCPLGPLRCLAAHDLLKQSAYLGLLRFYTPQQSHGNGCWCRIALLPDRTLSSWFRWALCVNTTPSPTIAQLRQECCSTVADGRPGGLPHKLLQRRRLVLHEPRRRRPRLVQWRRSPDLLQS